MRSVDVNEWANFRLYRGGDMLRIWIFNNQTHDVEEIPAARSNSGQPVWTDNNTIFFLSDRDNHYVNVYKYNLSSKAVTQVTALRDIDVKRSPPTVTNSPMNRLVKYFYSMPQQASQHTLLSTYRKIWQPSAHTSPMQMVISTTSIFHQQGAGCNGSAR